MYYLQFEKNESAKTHTKAIITESLSGAIFPQDNN